MTAEIRIVYVVPKDRRPDDDIWFKSWEVLEDLQWLLADLMRPYYGPLTFKLPHPYIRDLRIKWTRVKWTNLEFYGHYRFSQNWAYCPVTSSTHIPARKRCMDIAEKKGWRPKHDLDFVLYIHESCLMHDDGTVKRGGAVSHPRRHEMFIAALHFRQADRSAIWRESSGDSAGRSYGVILHEFLHCCGLNHLKKGHPQRHQRLMRHGYNNIRTAFLRPRDQNDCILSPEEAQQLSESGYLAPIDLAPRSIAFGPLAGNKS